MDKGASLTTQCLAFCQVLATQGQASSFVLTIGSTFSFSLDTNEKKMKRPSPSTEKRNIKRRKEFLDGKSESVKPADLETPRRGQPLNPFKCDQCEHTSITKEAVKVHTKETHKKQNIPQVEVKPAEKPAVMNPPAMAVKAGVVKPVCDLCKMTFLTANGLKVHKDMMHEENDNKCDCCNLTFPTQATLEGHIIEVIEAAEYKRKEYERKWPGGGPIHR
jgi:hypothetical protein